MGKSFYTWILMFPLAFLCVECDMGMPESQSILVSTEWLQSHLDDPDLLVLHAGTEEGFDSLHIPEARLIIPDDFTIYKDSMRNELPAMDTLVKILRKAGVNEDSKIVLCYENEYLISRTSRVYLTLVYAGFSGSTCVLNGGLPAWLEEGREATDKQSPVSMGNVVARAQVDILISTEQLEEDRWSSKWVLIDARSNEEYRGTPATDEEKADGGHIEGAYFLPYQTSFSEDKPYLFKTDAELEKLFQESGMDHSRTTVVYCGSGIRATVNYLAARHLGYPVLLYDGSYEEWKRLDLPLTGPVDRLDDIL